MALLSLNSSIHTSVNNSGVLYIDLCVMQNFFGLAVRAPEIRESLFCEGELRKDV